VNNLSIRNKHSHFVDISTIILTHFVLDFWTIITIFDNRHTVRRIAMQVSKRNIASSEGAVRSTTLHSRCFDVVFLFRVKCKGASYSVPLRMAVNRRKANDRRWYIKH